MIEKSVICSINHKINLQSYVHNRIKHTTFSYEIEIVYYAGKTYGLYNHYCAYNIISIEQNLYQINLFEVEITQQSGQSLTLQCNKTQYIFPNTLFFFEGNCLKDFFFYFSGNIRSHQMGEPRSNHTQTCY